MADEQAYAPVQIALTSVLRRQQMMLSVRTIHRTFRAVDVAVVGGGALLGLIGGLALFPLLGPLFLGIGTGIGAIAGLGFLAWRPLPGEHAGRAAIVVGNSMLHQSGVPRVTINNKSLPLYLGTSPAPRVAAGRVVFKRSTVEIPLSRLPNHWRRALDMDHKDDA